MTKEMTIKTVFIGLLSFAGICRAQNDVPYPVMFVTQVPQPNDYETIGALFGNHLGAVLSAPRGGDLWIRYPDGSSKNLTAMAGYGEAGQQGPTSIAVRQPAVHWSGTKALFSMVIGSATQRYEVQEYFWQIYEINGLGKGDVPVVTKIPNQPANYNNISAIYGSDDRIIFTTDRPRDGQAHLYPQRDEYEEANVVTGLWSLDPLTGDLKLLQHSPSGSYTPIIDSFGRLIFTRWDHLQRDQQADQDAKDILESKPLTNGTFNYLSESPGALPQFNVRTEIFPEPRIESDTLGKQEFNQFFPWQVNQDGTEEETLNHVGRHELFDYFTQSFKSDLNLKEFLIGASHNPNRIRTFLHIREDPQHAGRFFGINAPEFHTHSGGQIVSIEGAPSVNADDFFVTFHTPQSTALATPDEDLPPADHSGFYRSPLPLSDGQLLAVHSTGTRNDVEQPINEPVYGSRFAFRIKKMVKSGEFYLPGTTITSGISKSVTWWDPDYARSFSGKLWELDPVEVRPRARPPAARSHLPGIEAGVFSAEDVHVTTLKEYMKTQKLALIISRDVTTRDHADFQQPFNLRVNAANGIGVQSIGAPGTIYDVRYVQFFQADLIRGLGMKESTDTPRDGRRVLAQYLHDGPAMSIQIPNPSGPPGSVKIGADGSMAAFVPAQRAVTWQLTSPANEPVVRERYWLSLQSGEIRSCTSCHGLNTRDQANRSIPTNPPSALRDLLQHWKTTTGLGGTPRARWRQQHFGANANVEAIAGDGADPDGDTVSNFLEYSFGSDPKNAKDTALPEPLMIMSSGSPRLGITFQRPLSNTDLLYQVEFSNNLGTWTAGNSYAYEDELTSTAETIEVARSGSPVQTITVRKIAPANGAQFMRLRISEL